MEPVCRPETALQMGRRVNRSLIRILKMADDLPFYSARGLSSKKSPSRLLNFILRSGERECLLRLLFLLFLLLFLLLLNSCVIGEGSCQGDIE